jgi:hypothetical protein
MSRESNPIKSPREISHTQVGKWGNQEARTHSPAFDFSQKNLFSFDKKKKIAWE